MADSDAGFLVSQFLTVALHLVVYAGAAIAAFVYFDRARLAALLTLGGVLLLALVTVAQPLLHSYMVDRINAGTVELPEFSRTMGLVGLATTLVHVVGLAALIAAVFVGRATAPAAPPGAGRA